MILTAMLTALPSAMMAQQNIQKAFDALLNEKKVEIKTQHSLEVDPETGRKTEQADVYDFMVSSATGLDCINDIRKAFEKDRGSAYNIGSGSKVGGKYTALAVGEGSQPVAIGAIDGSEFIYACFLDKDDPEKKYRYAYAMEWLEKDKKTQVRLAITYATTQKYRQSGKNIRSVIVNGNEINVDGNSFSFGSGFPFDMNSVFGVDSVFLNREMSSESWLSRFNTYKNLFLKNPDGAAASYYATQIYGLCKNVDKMDEVEKKLVKSEILKLKMETTDEFIWKLFNMSIERLDK